MRGIMGVFAIGILASSIVTGCGSSTLEGKQTYPAHGVLTYKGEPVKNATIHLFQVDPLVGFHAEGDTDEEGRFVLRSYNNAEPDGAVPGEYTVVLDNFAGVNEGYETGLMIEIVAGENELKIEIP
jgi:hypothetical protein